MRLILLTAATIALLVANVFFGAIHIPASDIWSILTGKGCTNEAIEYIVLGSRIPQGITALLAGAGLASAGLMLQTVFRNPLAGPSVLGITSGASLGVALVILLFGGMISIGSENVGGSLALTAGALAGSLSVMGVLIALSARVGGNLTLLIAGMMTGYLASSVVTLLSSVSTAQGLHSYVMWGMGTFSGVTSDRLPWFSALTVAGLLMAIFLAKPLNLLLLGDNYAINLGVNIQRVRHMLLAATGLLSAVVTACCGPIGFIGLAMPHIARLIFRTDDHLILMPATMLCGAALALACNLVSVLPEGNIIPINAITPLAGVPVVLYVIIKKQ